MHFYEFQSDSLRFVEVSLIWCLSLHSKVNFSCQGFADMLSFDNNQQKRIKIRKSNHTHVQWVTFIFKILDKQKDYQNTYIHGSQNWFQNDSRSKSEILPAVLRFA